MLQLRECKLFLSFTERNKETATALLASSSYSFAETSKKKSTALRWKYIEQIQMDQPEPIATSAPAIIPPPPPPNDVALVDVERIADYDVLASSSAVNHPGTHHLRKILQEFTPQYYRANNRSHETEICREVLRKFREASDGRARFLKPCTKSPPRQEGAGVGERSQQWKVMKDAEVLTRIERGMQRACHRMLYHRAMSRAVLQCKKRIAYRKAPPPSHNDAPLPGLKAPPNVHILCSTNIQSTETDTILPANAFGEGVFIPQQQTSVAEFLKTVKKDE